MASPVVTVAVVPEGPLDVTMRRKRNVFCDARAVIFAGGLVLVYTSAWNSELISEYLALSGVA
jgi:hypothetical protein